MNKKVALFANGWNGENLDNFIAGMNSELQGANTDVFVFASNAAYSMSPNVRIAENSIYTLPDYSFFDAVIIYASGMNSDIAVTQIMDKCKEADVPIIMQGYDADGVSSVTVDNYAGMHELCEHLIEKHNVKDVIFIAGPKDNDDSNLRIKALKDSLAAHGYIFDDDKIVYANWESSIIFKYILGNYSDNLEALPDAFICANDSMAMSTLVALEKIGAKLPDDVIVTGFDNLSAGRVYYPSLASVDQCYREQGVECAKLVVKTISDKYKIYKHVIPCTAMPGESCGCNNCKNESEIRKMLGHDNWYKRYIIGNTRGRMSHLEMCITANDEYENIHNNVNADFMSVSGEETEDFHVYVNPEYKNLEYMNAKDGECRLNYGPILEVIAAKIGGVVLREDTVTVSELLLGYTGEGDGKTFVFSPLIIGNSVIGYMVMGYMKDDFADDKYFDFAVCLNMTMEKYQNNIKLARLNEKLSELMQKDALTDVKNRVAYDNYVTKMNNVISTGVDSNIAVVMCDINNLKTINDRLGHDAGDLYIKDCCQLMCKTFKHSPIFRVGGDEFIVVISTSDYDIRHQLLDDMRRKMYELNKDSISPLTCISIATGMADFDIHRDKCLPDVVKRADELMYINKAEMKAKLHI